jgi:hypothetical protein
VLEQLWAEDGLTSGPGFSFDPDLMGTGNAVLTLGREAVPPLWLVAHLDTISYLVLPEAGGRHPLVPHCAHLTDTGEREAHALRYDLASGRMKVCAEGRLVSEAGDPFFVAEGGERLGPGDRVVPFAPFTVDEGGLVTGHLDNAGGVAALAVAASVLARAGISARLIFPDEEEGALAAGNQSMSRGMARLASRLDPPDLAVVADTHRAVPADDGAATPGSLGAGAVMAEFSSLARGSVTPPPLYAAARAFMAGLAGAGVRVGQPLGGYTSRGDDASLMLRTPRILLLGYPGTDRHFDRALPTAHLADIVDLAKALAYASALPAALEAARPAGAPSRYAFAPPGAATVAARSAAVS